MKSVALGVIGCGVIGRHPLAAASQSPLTRVAAVADLIEKKGREIAAASAHFEHPVGGLGRDFLDDARLDLGRQHGLAVPERKLQVGEGERPVLLRNEVLPVQHVEQVEDLLIQHLPGADLLLDHVEAGVFDVHDCVGTLTEDSKGESQVNLNSGKS